MSPPPPPPRHHHHHHHRRHAIVIGAGPAGLSVAGLLADAGWHCDIYEALSEAQVAQTSLDYLERAYGLSCQVRAVRVLQRLQALSHVLHAGGYWREATYRHDAARGAVEVVSRRSVGNKVVDDDDDDDDDDMDNDMDFSQTLSCLRTELVAGLLSALRRHHPHRVHIHWECPVQSLQQQQQDDDTLICLVLPDGSQRHANVIICADGSNSPIGRTHLVKLDPSIAVSTEASGLSARTLLLHDHVDTRLGGANPTTTRQQWIPRRNSLHFILHSQLLVVARHAGPRPSSPALVSQIQTMIIYPDQHPQLASPHLTADQLRSVLMEAFTDTQLPLPAAATDEQLRQCAARRGAALPGTVHCSQYHYRNLVLLGDAAHCAPTNNAQGVNVAMEDAAILADLLLEQDKDESSIQQQQQQLPYSQQIEAKLAQFTRIRKPEMDALQRMLRHPFYASTRPTWRTRVVTHVHQRTGMAALGPMTDQVYQAQCSLVACERHMMVQYHLPVVLVGLAAMAVGSLVVLVLNLVFKLFTKLMTAPKGRIIESIVL